MSAMPSSLSYTSMCWFFALQQKPQAWRKHVNCLNQKPIWKNKKQKTKHSTGFRHYIYFLKKVPGVIYYCFNNLSDTLSHWSAIFGHWLRAHRVFLSEPSSAKQRSVDCWKYWFGPLLLLYKYSIKQKTNLRVESFRVSSILHSRLHNELSNTKHLISTGHQQKKPASRWTPSHNQPSISGKPQLIH